VCVDIREVGGELGGVMFCSDTDHGALPLADHLIIRVGEEEVASWVKRRGRQRGGGEGKARGRGGSDRALERRKWSGEDDKGLHRGEDKVRQEHGRSFERTQVQAHLSALRLFTCHVTNLQPFISRSDGSRFLGDVALSIVKKCFGFSLC
jgi:hypothetical protein